ncbi:MAG: acyltransferase [Muribaculaceae bacterium]|nr:acyltransferase [Muribaculaceae bacterium]
MYFNSLQSLRGLFALMIFFHHFNFRQNEGGMFEAGGDCGVTFFFILSGFVLFQNYLKNESQSPTIKNNLIFIGKRLSKIYPLHIVCLALACLLKLAVTIPDITNIFLVQAWIPFRTYYFSGNAIGWCLSDFLFFYAVFPFLAYGLRRSPLKFVGIFTVIVLLYILIGIPLIPSSLADGIIYINPLVRSMDFVYGMALCLIYKYLQSYKIKINLVDTVCVFIFTILIWYSCPSRYNLSLLWWPAVGFLILYATTTANKILAIKPLVLFGDVSFSFYLIHVLSRDYIDKFLYKIGLAEMNPGLRLFLILAFTILASFLVHRYFVLPIENLIRRHLNKRGPSPRVALN